MITTAILLAAGQGTRLRDTAESKPLCPIAGRALIDHALDGLAMAGMTRAIVVVGYRAAEVRAHLASRTWPLAVETIETDPARPNGVSALAGASRLGESAEALLAMCDHLVDPALYARVAGMGSQGGLTLGIDRRLGHAWVDPLDVTAVATEDDRIVAIGKGLEPHDAYDTGVFAIGPRLVAALATLEDPSLTEGVRLLAVERLAHTVEVSDLDWIDVDDAPAHAHAEAWRRGVGLAA